MTGRAHCQHQVAFFYRNQNGIKIRDLKKAWNQENFCCNQNGNKFFLLFDPNLNWIRDFQNHAPLVSRKKTYHYTILAYFWTFPMCEPYCVSIYIKVSLSYWPWLLTDLSSCILNIYSQDVFFFSIRLR